MNSLESPNLAMDQNGEGSRYAGEDLPVLNGVEPVGPELAPAQNGPGSQDAGQGLPVHHGGQPDGHEDSEYSLEVLERAYTAAIPQPAPASGPTEQPFMAMFHPSIVNYQARNLALPRSPGERPAVPVGDSNPGGATTSPPRPVGVITAVDVAHDSNESGMTLAPPVSVALRNSTEQPPANGTTHPPRPVNAVKALDGNHDSQESGTTLAPNMSGALRESDDQPAGEQPAIPVGNSNPSSECGGPSQYRSGSVSEWIDQLPDDSATHPPALDGNRDSNGSGSTVAPDMMGTPRNSKEQPPNTTKVHVGTKKKSSRGRGKKFFKGLVCLGCKTE